MRASQVRWAGDRSLLLEFETLEHAMSAHGQLCEQPIPGQLDAIAGARTVLIRLSGHTHARRARAELTHTNFPMRDAQSTNEILIDVVYDGPDLADAAAFFEMSPEALIDWHTGQAWMGAFPGFAGFTYCVTQEHSMRMPRRTSPRTSVPGGSVALAGEFSGVYPRHAPGGWQLIGRTDATMWDLDREVPSLIQPWDSVRYRQVRPEVISTSSDGIGAHPTSLSQAHTRVHTQAETHAHTEVRYDALEVLGTGLLALIEDFGREGSASLGAGPAGVMDRDAARDANHAVGNRTDAPVIENLFGGFQARGLRTSVLAVAGADVDITVRSDGSAPRSILLGDPFILLPGETVELGAPRRGARCVIAIRGGLWATPVLGSVSTDTHIKIGPPPISVGDTIYVGTAGTEAVKPPIATALRSKPDLSEDLDGETTLRVVFGPREFWFSPQERQRFIDQRWIVSSDSNRVGIRLGTDPEDPDARPLERARSGELLSEGMALGSLQVPPSGTPVLLVNDQGTTGGYPIIAVVLAQDLHHAAQLTPGSVVRFSPVDSESLEPASLKLETLKPEPLEATEVQGGQ